MNWFGFFLIALKREKEIVSVGDGFLRKAIKTHKNSRHL